MNLQDKIDNLKNYVYEHKDIHNIKFDKYNRPYLQCDVGRFMLRRNTEYNYTIKN